MLVQARAQFSVDLAGQVAKQPGTQQAEQRFEQRQRQQGNAQYLQAGHTPADQHPVDDVLEQQRRDQGYQLQHQRDQ
ncbi:hypothetical protein D3C78_486370 [compost metagenome]